MANPINIWSFDQIHDLRIGNNRELKLTSLRYSRQMALLHFAFGDFARKKQLPQQADEFCSKILLKKQLRGSLCPEFIPLINHPNALWAKSESAVLTTEGAITFSDWTNSPPVSLLPQDIWMICFADLPLNKLAGWPHVEHYGKLAIVFSNRFRSRINARQVFYYHLRDLVKDPKVISYNQALKENISAAKLRDELLAYRKPAILWPEFRRLFGVISLRHDENRASIEHITYSRYRDGYVFSTEAEARVITSSTNPYIQFEESDVLQIITPSSESQNQIQKFLNENWVNKPPVLLYPT